jgi:hypothetical protein
LSPPCLNQKIIISDLFCCWPSNGNNKKEKIIIKKTDNEDISSSSIDSSSLTCDKTKNKKEDIHGVGVMFDEEHKETPLYYSSESHYILPPELLNIEKKYHSLKLVNKENDNEKEGNIEHRSLGKKEEEGKRGVNEINKEEESSTENVACNNSCTSSDKESCAKKAGGNDNNKNGKNNNNGMIIDCPLAHENSSSLDGSCLSTESMKVSLDSSSSVCSVPSVLKRGKRRKIKCLFT